ncbi:MAG: 30S ribosomal protein S18 [Planctomycetes bacterium]|nr:30S ribosomal protein S18 [Planctomycetota bacterium]
MGRDYEGGGGGGRDRDRDRDDRDRDRDRDRGPGGPGGKRRRKMRRIDFVDYKDVPTLKKFLSPNGKLHSRKRNMADAKTQNKVQLAVKRARFMGLLSYTN